MRRAGGQGLTSPPQSADSVLPHLEGREVRFKVVVDAGVDVVVVRPTPSRLLVQPRRHVAKEPLHPTAR